MQLSEKHLLSLAKQNIFIAQTDTLKVFEETRQEGGCCVNLSFLLQPVNRRKLMCLMRCHVVVTSR